MTKSSQKIEELKLKNFTAFQNTTFEFSPGINVLIGANSTGKTHVMKIIYAIIKQKENGKNGKNAHSCEDIRFHVDNI